MAAGRAEDCDRGGDRVGGRRPKLPEAHGGPDDEWEHEVSDRVDRLHLRDPPAEHHQ